MDAARLRRDADIAAVWSDGRKLRHGLFALRARPNGLDMIRIAVSAPRSLGRAVARNRARRRLREAFRAAIGDLAPGAGVDIVIIARPETGDAAFADLRTAAGRALGTLAEHVATA